MVLQVAHQRLDTHPVHAGRSLVATDTLQRLPQISGLDHRLHRHGQPGRRAFGGGTRHTHFGPFSNGGPGFTLRHRRQGQFQLGFLPPGAHKRAVLLVLSIVRAFAGRPATMPSADFCAAITALTLPLSPDFPDTTQTSRGKTDRLHRIPAAFTTPALDGCGLRDHWLARPAG